MQFMWLIQIRSYSQKFTQGQLAGETFKVQKYRRLLFRTGQHLIRNDSKVSFFWLSFIGLLLRFHSHHHADRHGEKLLLDFG